VADHQELLRRKADILMPSAEGSTGLPQDLLSIAGLKKLFSGDANGNGTSYPNGNGDGHAEGGDDDDDGEG
jgi:hypothetical protein